MNSIQSNDIMTSMGGGKSTQMPLASPGSAGIDAGMLPGGIGGTATKNIKANVGPMKGIHGGAQLGFQIGNLN